MLNRSIVWLTLLFLLAQAAGPHAEGAAADGLPLFREPVAPAVYEVPANALATWRSFAGRKPALLLLANHPFLKPLAGDEAGAVRTLLRDGSTAELIRRGRLSAPDPAFVSLQAVSAAIAAGLISELIYVQPGSGSAAALTLADFQKKAYLAGFCTEAEALALTSADGVIRGTVRGLPFRVVPAEALPKIDVPLLIHVDLGFFLASYSNEITTPAYRLLLGTAAALRDAAYPKVLAVTLSFSNQEAGFSLEHRFMLNSFASMLLIPATLDGNVPASWVQLANAVYAGTLFNDELAEDFVARAVAVNPDNPAAHFAQALLLLKAHREADAFAALDRAIALDPGYAQAYLELAESARGIGASERVLQHLDKAAPHFPDNPFLDIDRAEALLRLARGREAALLLAGLQQLPWSERHHPGIAAQLAEMAKLAKAHSAPPQSP